MSELDLKLAHDCAQFYADPLGFVMWAFPWGEDGPLQNYDGPDEWQIDQLVTLGNEVRARGFTGKEPVAPVQMATASGHGIGKSALTSWIILWIMSTRPRAKGTVTANTADQLRTKTWGEMSKWHSMCITGHWFEYSNSKGNMNLKHRDKPDIWRVDAVTCKEENSEAFAGQHAADSTSFYLFDEASNVPNKIWEVSEGGQTDGEPFWLVFGNPTRNHGRFFDCFHRFRHRWITRQIDSRECKFPNKEHIKKWIHDWGEDSDFVRVRVRGVFPRAGANQLIPSDVVYEATRREPVYIDDDPMIVGIDVARGGEDQNVIVWRKGFDAQTFPTLRIPGEKSRDSMKLVSIIVDRLTPQPGMNPILVPDRIFVDETGLGGPIVDRLRQLGMPVIGINFGAKAMDTQHYRNMSAEMWFKMRQWLMEGGAIKQHPDLEMELTNRQFEHDNLDRLQLESKDQMKKRDLPSPDWADALALTFALPVARLQRDPRTGAILDNVLGRAVTDYDPLGEVGTAAQ